MRYRTRGEPRRGLVCHCTDRNTGKRIRTHGIEFWIMRGERVARWDGAVNAWEE